MYLDQLGFVRGVKFGVRKRLRTPSAKVFEAVASYIDVKEYSRKSRTHVNKLETSENITLCKKVSKSAVAKSEQPNLTRRNQINEQNPESGTNINPKGASVTTTRLINRIWGEYYSNFVSRESKRDNGPATRKRKACRDKTEGEKDVKISKQKKYGSDDMWMPYCPFRKKRSGCRRKTRWDGEAIGVTSNGSALYEGVFISGSLVSIGSVVLVEKTHLNRDSSICFVEYMFEASNERKIVHGRVMVGGFETVLGNNANKRELCLTNDCIDFEPSEVIESLVVKMKQTPWGYQHRKDNEDNDIDERERAEERRMKGLATEYFCRTLYCPEKGAFFSLKTGLMGLGSGYCHSCNARVSHEKNDFTVCTSMKSFTYQGVQYNVLDFLYLSPQYLMENQEGKKTVLNGQHQKPKAYVVCQLLGLEVSCSLKQSSPESVKIKVQRFFRPEDISAQNAYVSDIQEIYYSKKIESVPVMAVEGRCEVRKKEDFEFMDSPYIYEHTFFCQFIYDVENQSLELLPSHFKLSSSKGSLGQKAAGRKTKKKQMITKGGSAKTTNGGKEKAAINALTTLDIFAGCGGLSEGLEKSGVSVTKWAIESEETAAESFKLNHPDAITIVNDCNMVLRDIMMANGDANDCIPTSEVHSLASKHDNKEIKHMPRPGEVDLIIGGPPCQGFSLLNRHNKSSTSDVRRTMILSLLSFVDYFRPRFLLIENVRNLVCFDKMKPFQLTIASLLEMGYQVRFGVLEAGFYGVAQSRRRVFIWAASPEETLPEWPEPMHVFPGPDLRIKLDLNGDSYYTAVCSTKAGAPFRCLTVRDTIGDLPALANGDSATTMEYKGNPVSWFQKRVRRNMTVLTDHVSRKLSELNLIHCYYLPTGADWRDLPKKKVELSSGKFVDLKPQWLLKMQSKGSHSKGVLGRLEWEKNFPTAITCPQPRGKVGRWFHPAQDRLISVREYARAQGFPDSYKFAGTIRNKYQQVGNAVPPPLAFALGRMLREAIGANP
ncbi:unnamed protein product [Cuscuta epithymum]|uniref:Cytosine-specific methyltransferase n=1 Tax=Cuscuta epithymum TaxID=186058 RepID=A0AAV0EQQ2_9ASTE|nr:unnamed protein product [Cuscuta epithymum]